MAVENLKSLAITSLDSIPVVPVQSGNGAAGYLRNQQAFATISAAASVASTYQLVRLPTNARVKRVEFEAEAMGAGKFQLSAYYSDSTVDGTPAANQGLVVPTSGAGFFSDDIDCTSAVVPANKLGGAIATNGLLLARRNKELWDALGLTSDPGGFIDVVAVVHTTAVTTGAAKIGVSVDYVV